MRVWPGRWDVNGDGYDDVIVGASHYDGAGGDEGAAFVHLGSSAGLRPAPDWMAIGEGIGYFFGCSVAGAGDFNGDGYDDGVVGAYDFDGPIADEGAVYAYFDSPDGLSPTWNWRAVAERDWAFLGYAVAAAGDVNGDGYSDILAGAPKYEHGEWDEGRAYVYLGSAAGPAATPAWVAEADRECAWFGIAVGPAGDVDGDGFADVAVGASYYSAAGGGEGRIYVFRGSMAGLATEPAWTADGAKEGASLGYAVVSAGDVDGDGRTDLIAGAPGHPNGSAEVGQACLFLGWSDGLARLACWIGEGTQAQARFGMSVHAAGDVNGDGFTDAIIGADCENDGQVDEGVAYVYAGCARGLEAGWLWRMGGDQAGAWFGCSAASAGDVNGDGFSDIVVGARGYDNGESDEGRAALYLGSPAGPEPASAWTAEGEQVEAGFGEAVAGAGDVDGDGFGDVLVGAPHYDHGADDEGRVFLYQGSPEGLSATASWTAEGDQAAAGFGQALACAGDVNGDGFSDVVIGAPSYAHGQAWEGRATVYLGCASGLEPAPAWAVEGDQAAAFFGSAVAAAGDVNADGFGDLIVGAPLYQSVHAMEGRAFVYLGSALGVAPEPVWIADGGQAEARFGATVASAGDVNGDGYSDIAVGAPGYDGEMTDEGGVFVYLGSPDGPARDAAWMAVGGETSAGFGAALGSVGDASGDGYADILVGAPWCDLGAMNQGRAWAFLGNGRWTASPGLPLLPGQHGLTATRIDLLGRSDDPFSFRLSARGRTPAGRGRVRLEWQVARIGMPLGQVAVASGAWQDTGAPGGAGSVVPLTGDVSGLEAGAPYHWRLRVACGSPFFAHSPWLTLARSVPSEKQLRMAGQDLSHALPGDPSALSSGLRIATVRPNPLLPDATITYQLPAAGRVRLAIYDAAGRHVRTLVDRTAVAGEHAVAWDGCDAQQHPVDAGVYFARLDALGEARTRKMVLGQ